MIDEVHYITMERQCDGPFIIMHHGREVCLDIMVYTDYEVHIDKDIETDELIAPIECICIDYDIVDAWYKDTYDPVPLEDIQYSAEDKALLQAFADSNSSFSEDEIMEELYNERHY